MSPDKLYDYFYNSKSVSIDSRTVKKGDIYFALKAKDLMVINLPQML
jgi:UDP-N-acetylmuramyl pentapeptide synthase